MSKSIMKLGDYTFSVDTAAPGRLSRSSAYRWGAQERHGREAALQYLGPGADSVSISGVVYPHFRGGLSQVEALRAEAGQGRPLLFVDGQGGIHGRWVVEGVDETRQELFPDGTPRRMEFTLKLKFYGGTDVVPHQGR